MYHRWFLSWCSFLKRNEKQIFKITFNIENNHIFDIIYVDGMVRRDSKEKVLNLVQSFLVKENNIIIMYFSSLLVQPVNNLSIFFYVMCVSSSPSRCDDNDINLMFSWLMVLYRKRVNIITHFLFAGKMHIKSFNLLFQSNLIYI